MSKTNERFEPGQRVIVTQQIPQRAWVWTTHVEGAVVKFEQSKTGSWFARSKADRLWLDRLTIRKDDGEIVVCNLDAYTHVQPLPAPAEASDAAAYPAEESAESQPAAGGESPGSAGTAESTAAAAGKVEPETATAKEVGS